MVESLTQEQLQVKAQENEWLLDCVLSFMRSPRWRAPVVSFIEEYCLIFDNEEENKLEYTNVHKNFVKMVDELLCELIAEVGIERDDFYAACELSTHHKTHYKLVQQILAVEDFNSFKRMMIRKNQEFNEAAMKSMLEAEQVSKGQTPHVEQPVFAGESEEEMIARAISESQQLENNAKLQLDEEDEMLRRAIEASKMDEETRKGRASSHAELDQKEAEIMARQQKLAEEQKAFEGKLRLEEEGLSAEERKLREKEAAQKAALTQEEAQKVRELQEIKWNQDKEQAAREAEKIRQLMELKRQNSQPKAPEPKPEPIVVKQPEPEQPVIVVAPPKAPEKVQVKQTTAFEDIYSNEQLPPGAPDPYAGMSFSEVLKAKRSALDKQVAATALANPEAAKIAAEQKSTDAIETRKRQLQEHRRQMLEQRKAERDKELMVYNEVKKQEQMPEVQGNNDFHTELLKMEAVRLEKEVARKDQQAKAAQQHATNLGQQQQQMQSQQQEAEASVDLFGIKAVNIN